MFECGMRPVMRSQLTMWRNRGVLFEPSLNAVQIQTTICNLEKRRFNKGFGRNRVSV